MEHHSNIVPWQILCEEKNAILRIAPINERGELMLDEFEKLLNARTKLVSIVHVSNALGTINPVAEITRIAHRHGVPVFIDGAQAVAHMKVDVQALDCDFYSLSGHKMFGPTGIGVLYGKAALLDKMPPYQGGGDMIRSVTFAKTTYNELPYKFEAGTPNIAGTIGLGAAIDYINEHRPRSHRRLRARPAGLRHRATGSAFPACASSARRARRPACFRSCWKACIRTMSARFSTAKASRCAPAIIARSRCWNGSACPPPRARRWPSTTPEQDIDALVAGIGKVKEIFG